jgi:long-chain acyl-CoA synthetase
MYPGVYAIISPRQPAVVMSDSGQTLTYADLEERSVRLSQLLHERGLRRGDSFALLSENSPRYYEAYWAAQRSGLYLTAINHHLKRDEISYILTDFGAKALLVSANKAEQALQVVDDTPAITSRFAFNGAVSGHEDYETALAASSAIPLEDNRVGADMLYSSGTTGLPKAIKAPLPERRVDDPGDPFVEVFGKMYRFGRDTVYLCPAPLYHAAPLRFGGWVHALGGTVVVMPSFDALAALRAIEQYQITHSQWVPTMFVRMLKLEAEQCRLRPVQPPRGHPCCCSLPGRGQGGDDRLVGPNPARVLRGHRGQRHHPDRLRAMAEEARLGRPGRTGRAAHLRRGRRRATHR